MVKKGYDSLGVNVTFNVPDSVEEFNKLDPSRKNACLEEGINNVVYRGVMNQFRAKFVEEVLKATGYKPEIDEDKNWVDSEKTVFKKALIHSKKAPDAFKSLAQKIADEIKFDPTAKPRGSGEPKKVAKIYLEAADQIIAKKQQEAVAAKLTEVLGVTVTADREGLARGISANEARKRAEQQAKMAEAYGNLKI